MSVQPATSVGGENYGWSVMEGTFCHDPAPPGCAVSPPTCSDPSYTEPIHDYTHAAGDCSVIGGFVYRGSDVPALVGRYVFSDYCTGNVWALSEDPPGQWTRELLAVAGFGVTSLGHDANGELYLTRGNEVLRIAPADAIPALPRAALAAAGLLLLWILARHRSRPGAR